MLNEAFAMHQNIGSLYLREFQSADRYALVEMHQDARVKSMLVDDQPLEHIGVASQFIKKISAIYRNHPGLGIWCAEQHRPVLTEADLANPEVTEWLTPEAIRAMSKPQPNFVGWFSLMPLDDDVTEFEIGSRLVPSVWGTQLAVRGGEFLLQHGFDRLRLPRLWIACHPEHHSVHYIAHALGFEFDGLHEYNDQIASYFVLSASRWTQWQALPRRQRIKNAIRQVRSGKPLSLIEG
jgi:RimJ/RimL family protein N-acetyltransferase